MTDVCTNIMDKISLTQDKQTKLQNYDGQYLLIIIKRDGFIHLLNDDKCLFSAKR